MTKKQFKQKIKELAINNSELLKKDAELQYNSKEFITSKRDKFIKDNVFYSYTANDVSAESLKSYKTFEEFEKDKYNFNYEYSSIHVSLDKDKGYLRRVGGAYFEVKKSPKWFQKKLNDLLKLEINKNKKYTDKKYLLNSYGEIDFPSFAISTYWIYKNDKNGEKDKIIKKYRKLKNIGELVEIQFSEIQDKFRIKLINWTKWAREIETKKILKQYNIKRRVIIETTRERDTQQRVNQYKNWEWRFCCQNKKLTKEQLEETRKYNIIEKMINIKEEYEYEMNRKVRELFTDDEKVILPNTSIQSELRFKLIKALNRVNNATIEK